MNNQNPQNQQNPSNWYPPGSQPPMYGYGFDQGEKGYGKPLSMKTGNSGTPVDGHNLISGNINHAADPNSKQFDRNHDHFFPGAPHGTDRGFYNG